jgi:quinol-cytochrome oxidoreductase complex cytochrome b subunit
LYFRDKKSCRCLCAFFVRPSTVVELLRGGVGVGQSTLTRFYSLHFVFYLY